VTDAGGAGEGECPTGAGPHLEGAATHLLELDGTPTDDT